MTFFIAFPASPSPKILKDNKITKREAQTLVDKIKMSYFPLNTNDEVLEHLYRLLGTPGARKHMRECLKRMKKYQPLLSKKIKQQQLPQELLAIPLVESGYQNIHSQHGWGSGLWMFIKPTAKSYGLKINKKTDQRLNVKLSTDAALKYIKSNHKIFKDWHLTVMAYNIGEFGVKKALKKTKAKNAWTLVHKGHERDKGYLAKIIAVAIIIQNPKILD
jgi:membrane-bound lytic murein transglycosylase D